MSCCTTKYNRTIIRGDSDRFKVTFTKKTTVNGKDVYEPVDITNWTVRFTVREDVPATDITSDTDALINIEADLVTPKEGIAMVYVPATITTKIEPGTYYYDIQYIKPTDEYGYNQIHSIRKAKYIIVGDITRDNTLKLDGGNSTDFSITDETDYTVTYTVETDKETLEEKLVPVATLNPCKDYDGGYADKEAIARFIDGLNAKYEKAPIDYVQHKDYDSDEEVDDADDGYEI
jgi:hypothetical protein